LTAVPRPGIEQRITSLRHPLRAGVLWLAALATVGPVRADPNVVVSSFADPDYTWKKYAGEKPRRETYVVMQGRYYESVTVDKSIERMPFRRIMEVFAPELARREYFPATGPREADLLIVVHWGTTNPQTTMLEMAARTSPTLDTTGVDNDRKIRIDDSMAKMGALNDPTGMLFEVGNEGGTLRQNDIFEQVQDQIAVGKTAANIAELLGYSKALRQEHNSSGTTADEYALRADLKQERYFIVLKAYDLKTPAPPGRPKPTVWTMHLNMSSPGNNFGGAVAKMSAAAVNFVGRATDRVETVEPNIREGKVEVGPLTIVEAKK
jgi:hypothetical protein